MAFDAATRALVREKMPGQSPPRSIVCPRCGGTNPASSKRCRACLTHLEASGKPAPRIVTPVIEPGALEVDAALGELEALTRAGGATEVRFQCPNCRRIVSASATRCACGAVFEERSDVVGYECPLCGARVSASATRCTCGARFSE